jgi:hypothetical protein
VFILGVKLKYYSFKAKKDKYITLSYTEFYEIRHMVNKFYEIDRFEYVDGFYYTQEIRKHNFFFRKKLKGVYELDFVNFYVYNTGVYLEVKELGWDRYIKNIVEYEKINLYGKHFLNRRYDAIDLYDKNSNIIYQMLNKSIEEESKDFSKRRNPISIEYKLKNDPNPIDIIFSIIDYKNYSDIKFIIDLANTKGLRSVKKIIDKVSDIIIETIDRGHIFSYIPKYDMSIKNHFEVVDIPKIKNILSECNTPLKEEIILLTISKIAKRMSQKDALYTYDLVDKKIRGMLE